MNGQSMPEDNKRRRFLLALGATAGTVFALGSPASAAMIGEALSYKRAMSLRAGSGLLFTQRQLQQLQLICAVVIPETETPGAHQVDTHGFIDNQLVKCFPEKVQKAQVRLQERIHKASKARFGKDLIAASPDQQFALLSDIDMGREDFSKVDRQRFRQLKGLIAFGYYTSEVGMTEELQYLPYPGGYDGNYPYSKGEGAWAS